MAQSGLADGRCRLKKFPPDIDYFPDLEPRHINEVAIGATTPLNAEEYEMKIWIFLGITTLLVWMLLETIVPSLKINSCLDSGGRWVNETGICEHTS